MSSYILAILARIRNYPSHKIFMKHFRIFVILYKYALCFLTIMLFVIFLTKCFFDDTINTSIEKLLNTDGSWSLPQGLQKQINSRPSGQYLNYQILPFFYRQAPYKRENAVAFLRNSLSKPFNLTQRKELLLWGLKVTSKLHRNAK